MAFQKFRSAWLCSKRLDAACSTAKHLLIPGAFSIVLEVSDSKEEVHSANSSPHQGMSICETPQRNLQNSPADLRKQAAQTLYIQK